MNKKYRRQSVTTASSWKLAVFRISSLLLKQGVSWKERRIRLLVFLCCCSVLLLNSLVHLATGKQGDGNNTKGLRSPYGAGRQTRYADFAKNIILTDTRMRLYGRVKLKLHPVIYYLEDETKNGLPLKRKALSHGNFEGKASTIRPEDVKNYEVIEGFEKYLLAREKAMKPSGRATSFPEQEECVPMAEWQMKSFPTCNSVHEMDLTNLQTVAADEEQVRLVGSGSWRDAWMVRETTGSKIALKNLQMDEDFSENDVDWHRRDAIVMERLTSSPYIADIYGYCGGSGLYEYSSGGTLEDAIDPRRGGRVMSKLERLWIAVQVALSVADLHNFHKEGLAAFAHTDLDSQQFLYMDDGHFKLNDFNRGRFISWNEEKKEPCKFYTIFNPNKFRSPEEYRYEWLTAKIDIFQMGNIFYLLLTGKEPFEEEYDERRVWPKVISGERPHVPDELKKSVDLIDVALFEAMKMCSAQDPEDRATAREVANYLVKRLQEVDKEQQYSIIPKRPTLPSEARKTDQVDVILKTAMEMRNSWISSEKYSAEMVSRYLLTELAKLDS